MNIQVRQLTKHYANQTVLDGLDLDLPSSGMLAVLGRSGSGKTTLLKIMAGLETPDSGDILVNGSSVLHLKPNERQMIYLYQEPLLFPHLNVRQNIAFGLRIRHVSTEEMSERVSDMISRLGLDGYDDKMPSTLSGGQKQRVAFGRALIIRPRLLLLDEPFGNLDVETRTDMQKLLKQVALDYQITSIFVTHDIKEAILMGDQWAYMKNGKLKGFDSVYPFISDPATGASHELEFWSNLLNQKGDR